MDHAYEQVLLLGIREELNVHLPAVMADHREASDFVLFAIRIDHPCEAPVHLVCFSRTGPVTAAAVPLRGDCLPLCRNKILMAGNVSLECCKTSCIAKVFKLIKDHAGVFYSGHEHVVDDRCETRQYRCFCLAAFVAMRLKLKVIPFQLAQPGSCDTCPALKLSKVYLLQGE